MALFVNDELVTNEPAQLVLLVDGLSYWPLQFESDTSLKVEVKSGLFGLQMVISTTAFEISSMGVSVDTISNGTKTRCVFQ